MKVIIKKTNEIKEVSFGHAVNYLLPRGLAVKATEQNLKKLKAQQDAEQKKQQAAAKTAKQKATGLAGKTISFKVKSGKKGKIYGAITKKDIAEKLGLMKSEVLLDEPIKKVGEYEIKCKINSPAGEEKCKIKVIVGANHSVRPQVK